MKILCYENIDPIASEILKSKGHSVILHNKSINLEDQINDIVDCDILCIRSRSEITKDILHKAKNLKSIGCFCIGVNQVDLSNAESLGIPVFNAPFSNTRSVAEMIIGEIIILSRNIHIRNTELHRGIWKKTSKDSFEIRGKTLGIIGYGRIGSQLSILAENLGMNVIYYDIEKKLSIGNAIAKSFEEVLSESDFISIHVPENNKTKNMITKKELSMTKCGVRILNAARGNVIVIDDLIEKIKDGHISSVAIDVFPKEPKKNDDIFESELIHLDNVLLTPHIGGSTMEAQKNIALEVVDKIINFIENGSTIGAVNIPNVSLSMPEDLMQYHRIIHTHKNVPGILEKINTIISNSNLNIIGQILQTNKNIGYVITDISLGFNKNNLLELQKIQNTINVRILK